MEYRKLNKLGFSRDSILASILSTALANYEIERVTGLTFCEDEFHSAIKNYIPPKTHLQGLPHPADHLRARPDHGGAEEPDEVPVNSIDQRRQRELRGEGQAGAVSGQYLRPVAERGSEVLQGQLMIDIIFVHIF